MTPRQTRTRPTVLRPPALPRALAPLLAVPLLVGLPARALPAGTLAAGAGAAEQTESAIRTEIEFARGLAADWQFVDLAEKVLGEIEASAAGAELGEELALAKCDIYAEGAKSETDPERREDLYEKAVTAYQDFLDEFELGEFAAEAERSYVDLCNDYGLHLARELEDAVGEEAARIRERIETVLTDAAGRTGELVEGMRAQDLTESQKRQLHTLLYNRGQLYLTLGKAAESGEYYLNQAESVLEDLAFSAGENSGFGLLAYRLMGEIYAYQGQWDYSADYYEFVVRTAIPPDPDAWQRVKEAQNPAQLQDRWLFAEMGTGGLVEALSTMEEWERATSWALHYYNTWQREGFNLDPPYGYLSLLSVARTLLASGGFVGGPPGAMEWFATAEEMEEAGYSRRQRQTAQGLAVAIADLVNRDNRGNTLQIRAQKLISEIISNPGVDVPPEVLFEAAKGEQNAKDYAAAVGGFKRVLAAIETEDRLTQQLFAPKVYYNLGRTFARMDRHLEAAMVHREGVTRWGGDPEFDPQNAEGYRRAMVALRREAKDDPRLDELWREAEDLVVEIGVGAEDVLYNKAKRTYDSGDYAEARAAFKSVPGKAKNYEKALTFAAVSAIRMGDEETGRRELLSYLNDYLTDPTNATTSEAKLGVRREAKAQATYYLGRLAFENKDYDRAIELLATYNEKFPDQTSYGPAALYMALNAYLAKKDFDAARAVHETMREEFPSAKHTGAGSLNIYKVLEREQDRAAAAGNEERARDLLERMAENIQLSNQLTGTRDFAKLRAESRHWMDLQEWKKAHAVLSKIAKLYDEGTLEGATERDMESFVYPDLGHALLELHNVNDALTYLEPLVPDPDAEDGPRVSSQTVLDYCRAITGWVEGGEGEFLEVPGAGGDEAFDKATSWLVKIANSVEKWQCEWYGLKFDLAYAYYSWGRLDSARTGTAMRQIRTLRTELGPDLRGEGGSGGISGACGDDVLRRRFLELWERVQ